MTLHSGDVNVDTVEVDPVFGTTGSFLTVTLTATQGPPGPAGADGTDGQDGAQGAAGPQGPQGATGAAGPQGAAGTNGSNGAAGAQGATGSQGPQGVAGAQGPAGADGADGADGQGVPTGGTTGQVLAKASGTDFDDEWVDQTGGSFDPTADETITGDWRFQGDLVVANTEPADGDLANGEMGLWYEPTADAPVVHYKAKDADGEVFDLVITADEYAGVAAQVFTGPASPPVGPLSFTIDPTNDPWYYWGPYAVGGAARYVRLFPATWADGDVIAPADHAGTVESGSIEFSIVPALPESTYDIQFDPAVVYGNSGFGATMVGAGSGFLLVVMFDRDYPIQDPTYDVAANFAPLVLGAEIEPVDLDWKGYGEFRDLHFEVGGNGGPVWKKDGDGVWQIFGYVPATAPKMSNLQDVDVFGAVEGDSLRYDGISQWFAHTPDASDVAFTPTGGVAATDVQGAIAELASEKAPLASPALTGNPTAPTPSAADNDTSIATTAFVQGELTAKAPLASPTFTGTPAAPTASQGTNTTQLASTAYVQTEAGMLIPKSLVDAAGDLLVGTADNTVGRLAKGTALQVLRVNAGATALEYATPAAGSITRASVVGGGGGDISVTSTSAVDVSGMSVTIAATAGQHLIIAISGCCYLNGSIGPSMDWFIDVAGTTRQTNRCLPARNTSPVPHLAGPFDYTVVSGDISGGNVTVKMRAKVSAGEIFIANGSGLLPSLSVLNVG